MFNKLLTGYERTYSHHGKSIAIEAFRPLQLSSGQTVGRGVGNQLADRFEQF
jgi:hypothetical protein